MVAAHEGHSNVAKILLHKQANVSVAGEGGATALHLSAQNGHLAVTVDLIKAGADLEAQSRKGATPLHLAAHKGHSGVMAALIGAGAEIDSRVRDGGTPLYMAALNGRLDAVKYLLRVNANPLLATTTIAGGEGVLRVPLDVAARGGHSEVACELIQQAGIEGCGGGTGGVDALAAAGISQRLEIMAMVTDAGVVDTGFALLTAAACGQEASVKFLLQQGQRRGGNTADGRVGYIRQLARWFGHDAFAVQH